MGVVSAARRRSCRARFLAGAVGQTQGMFHIIGLILLGLLVGLLGRLFHPGRDKMGLLMTIVIGVASVLIAGMLIGGFLGFIVAVIVGVVLVALWARFVEPRRAPGWRQKLHMD
jgi:uncharacterized membrane protein YeaQ/YmgE (transglycosylase-associated protein family)